MFSKRTDWSLETNRLSAALAAHRASGKNLLDLTISNPTECGFRYDENGIREALSRAGVMVYAPNPRGMLSARGAVAEYYAERGVRVSTEDIFLTASTSEAYSFIFRLLCDPEAEVLVPSPSYPLFDFLAEIHDVHLTRYPLTYENGWQIDFAELERAITKRTRGIIVVHPNNPTGHYAKASEIEPLNQVCAAHDLALIADEVFFDFCVEGESLCSSFAANSQALTFTMSGLSKISGLPQMKAAWLALSGPGNLKTQAAARLEIITDTYLSVNTPVQVALPALLAQRHDFQKQLMARLRSNLAEMDRQLARSASCSRLKVEGGWYAVLRIPTRNDEEFAVELLEKHSVYTHPGHFYDFSEPNFLVISLLTREEDFAEGLRRLLDYCG